jgi:hypothetical protein
MKHLSNYTDDAISKALEDNKAFFCFSNERFEEKREKGVKYSDLGGGLIAPTKNAKKLAKRISNIIRKGIEKDIKENGIDNIIYRELSNHEAFYMGDISDTFYYLSDYKVTREQVQKIYNQHKNEHY